jgi:paraquat-inducible protein B
MADPPDRVEFPQATVAPAKRFRISVVWIIPILAAVVALGIAVQHLLSEGPTITIIFSTADGIDAGKPIKYKDVEIGQVTQVQLTSDYRKVEVTARVSRQAAALMVEDAKFWIVEPRVTPSGVSGLGTLLSGNYIGFEAGKSDRSARTFVGLDAPPPIVTDQPGRQYLLKAPELGSLGIGSPVYYRRLNVGQVIAYDLAADGTAVDVAVFVKSPYERYVTTATRFWNASGLDVALTVSGVRVRTPSLAALLQGGVAFETPDFVPQAAPAPANSVFVLYSDRTAAMKPAYVTARRYVLKFNESVDGLAVGAPVMLLGLPAGEVTAIGLALDPATAKLRPQVTITLDLEHLLQQSASQRDAILRRLVEQRGLRAQLKTQNLVTGQAQVAFNYVPDDPAAKIDLGKETPELPVARSGAASIEAKVSSVLDKIDRLPLDAIASGLRKDLEDLDQTLNQARKLIAEVDASIVPALKTNLESVQRTLSAVERAMSNADKTVLAPNAPVQEDLRGTLQELGRAAHSLRMLVDYLERHPEALIRGRRPDMTSGAVR